MKNVWRMKKGIRRGKVVGLVLRNVRGHWRTVGWLNNVSFAKRVVAQLNAE